MTHEDEPDQDREAILARRRRFVTAALTGLTTSTLATACPCLKAMPPDAPEPSPSNEGMDAESAESTEDAPESEGTPESEDAPESPDAPESEDTNEAADPGSTPAGE